MPCSGWSPSTGGGRPGGGPSGERSTSGGSSSILNGRCSPSVCFTGGCLMAKASASVFFSRSHSSSHTEFTVPRENGSGTLAGGRGNAKLTSEQRRVRESFRACKLHACRSMLHSQEAGDGGAISTQSQSVSYIVVGMLRSPGLNRGPKDGEFGGLVIGGVDLFGQERPSRSSNSTLVSLKVVSRVNSTCCIDLLHHAKPGEQDSASTFDLRYS